MARRRLGTRRRTRELARELIDRYQVEPGLAYRLARTELAAVAPSGLAPTVARHERRCAADTGVLPRASSPALRP